jgi:hypothetical protein
LLGLSPSPTPRMRNGSAILQWSFPSSRWRICIREPTKRRPVICAKARRLWNGWPNFRRKMRSGVRTSPGSQEAHGGYRGPAARQQDRASAPPARCRKNCSRAAGMEAIIEPARIPSSRPTITRRRRGQGAAASTGRSTFSSRRSAVGNRRGSGAAPKCRLWSALCTCGASAQKIAAKISLKDP